MDAVLEQQMRRELLDRLRAEGGQASWRTLPVWEYEVLQQMEQEGLIERVQEAEPPARLTFRIRPH